MFVVFICKIVYGELKLPPETFIVIVELSTNEYDILSVRPCLK